MSDEAIRARYCDLLDHAPANIEMRLSLVEAVGRQHAIEAVEQWRDQSLHRKPLDRRLSRWRTLAC